MRLQALLRLKPIPFRRSLAWLKACPDTKTNQQRLERVDHAAAHEVVVLASLACVSQGQIRCSRIEVADLSANAEPAPDLDVQSRPDLEHTRGGGTTRVRAVVDEVAPFAEVAETAAETDPGRNRGLGKQIYPNRGSDEDLGVFRRNDGAAGVEFLIQIEGRRHLSQNGEDGSP